MLVSSVPHFWGTFDRKSILLKLIIKFFLKGVVFMFWHDIVYMQLLSCVTNVEVVCSVFCISMMVGLDPICSGVAFEFLCSQEVICGNTGKVLFLQNKRKPAATRKPNHKNTQTNNKTRKPNHKYTNKQNNQNLGR